MAEQREQDPNLLLTAGNSGTGWSEALTAIKREMMELINLSR